MNFTAIFILNKIYTIPAIDPSPPNFSLVTLSLPSTLSLRIESFEASRGFRRLKMQREDRTSVYINILLNIIDAKYLTEKMVANP